MVLQNLSIFLLLLILINCLIAQQICSSKDNALIIALLALHSGEDCEIIVQKGLQQIAALETTLNKINEENNLKIDLKFFDTCSNIDETVKSTLRATVFADDEECSGKRFFLGFLGPDDSDSLKAVGKISGFFKHSHVVPRAMPGYGQFNVFNVEVSQPEEKTKGIGLLLKKMNWISFIVVYTSDTASKEAARSLVELNYFCVLPFALEIPSALFGLKNNSAYNKLLHVLQKVPDARVVLLADTSESVENLLNYLDGSVIGVKFLIYLQGSGIFPWKLKWELAKDCIVLQETTKSLMVPAEYESYIQNTTLWSMYVNQNHFCKEKDGICKSFNLVVDSTILPLIYSLRLYSSALKTAHRKKCQKRGREVGSAAICNELLKMNPNEWREILENSRAFAKDEAGMNHKIGFYMVLDNVVDVFVYGGNESFNKVGSIFDGNDMSIYDSLNLFQSAGDRNHQCSHLIGDETTTLLPTVQWEETNDEEKPDEEFVKTPDDYSLFGLWFPNDDFGYYKLVGTIVGFVTSVTVIILLMAYFVYRAVRIKARSDSDASIASRSP